jgi:hypothetical protein
MSLPASWPPDFQASLPNTAKQPTAVALTIDDAVALVKERCDPTFLAAVRAAGGKFLYRGEDLIGSASLFAPSPDLLQFDTYDSNEALRYFTELEQLLTAAHSVARPSSGHLAVARRDAAAQWGVAVSVWPLGRPLHYVWPKSRPDFWPRADPSNSHCSTDAYNIDRGLEDALRLGREVLFASQRGAEFVIIAADAEDEVRDQLFGLGRGKTPWRVGGVGEQLGEQNAARQEVGPKRSSDCM